MYCRNSDHNFRFDLTVKFYAIDAVFNPLDTEKISDFFSFFIISEMKTLNGFMINNEVNVVRYAECRQITK